jgi:hypothetical protein
MFVRSDCISGDGEAPHYLRHDLVVETQPPSVELAQRHLSAERVLERSTVVVRQGGQHRTGLRLVPQQRFRGRHKPHTTVLIVKQRLDELPGSYRVREVRCV